MLGSNQLGSWEAACQLDRFPSLRDARLSDNPITAAAPSTARYQCIARIRWVKFGAGLPFGWAGFVALPRMHQRQPLLLRR
jgi:hypothetical protein